MPACCMCALQFPALQCGSYYKGCDALQQAREEGRKFWSEGLAQTKVRRHRGFKEKQTDE